MMAYTTDGWIQITPLRNPLPHNPATTRKTLESRDDAKAVRDAIGHSIWLSSETSACDQSQSRVLVFVVTPTRETLVSTLSCCDQRHPRARFRSRAERANSSHPKTLSGASHSDSVSHRPSLREASLNNWPLRGGITQTIYIWLCKYPQPRSRVYRWRRRSRGFVAPREKNDQVLIASISIFAQDQPWFITIALFRATFVIPLCESPQIT